MAEAYLENFVMNGYDTLEMCASLETSDLDFMEISAIGHRKKILKAASELAAKTPSGTAKANADTEIEKVCVCECACECT